MPRLKRSVPPVEHQADPSASTVDTVLKRDVFSTVERGTWTDRAGVAHPPSAGAGTRSRPGSRCLPRVSPPMR